MKWEVIKSDKLLLLKLLTLMAVSVRTKFRAQWNAPLILIFQLHTCEVSRPSLCTVVTLTKFCPHTDILNPGYVPTTTSVVVPATKRCVQDHVSPSWHTSADSQGGKHYLTFLLMIKKTNYDIRLPWTRNNIEYFFSEFLFYNLGKVQHLEPQITKPENGRFACNN